MHPKMYYLYIYIAVSGICQGLTAGSYNISYAIGKCNSHSETDAAAGLGSSFHIIVEELRVDSINMCSASFPVQC